MNRHTIKYVSGLLLFGLNGIIANYIILSSYEIVFLRTLIGSLFLILLFYLSGQRLYLKYDNPKELCFVILSGISMGASWIFLYEAYQRIGVGLSSIAYYLGPVIVMLLAPFLFNKKMGMREASCFVIVLIGVILININTFDSNMSDTYGLLCGLLSAIFHALMVIFTMKAPGISGIKNSMLQLIMSFLTVFIFICFAQGITLPSSGFQWFWIAFLGIINTGIGCYLYFSSISKISVQTVSILGYLEPLSAVIFSLLILHERLTIFQIIGALLILLGAMIYEFKTRQSPN